MKSKLMSFIVLTVFMLTTVLTSTSAYGSVLFESKNILVAESLEDSCLGNSLRSASEEEAALFTDVAQNSEHFNDFKHLLSEEEEFAMNEQVTVAITDEGYVYVSFAVDGGAGYSFFTAMLDYDTSTIISAMAGLHKYVGDNIHALYYTDGEVSSEFVVATSGTIISGFVLDADGNKVAIDTESIQSSAQSCWVPCMNSCLSGAGLPNWLISMAVGACQVVCLAGPVPCAGCWILFFGAHIFLFNMCVGSCNYACYGGIDFPE